MTGTGMRRPNEADGHTDGTVWTHAVWVVQPGREDDFVDAWSALGDWTVTEFPAATGTLLRDRDDPRTFISFGPWVDADAAAAWRSSDGFARHVAVIRETLERFEPRLLLHVVTKSAAAPTD